MLETDANLPQTPAVELSVQIASLKAQIAEAENEALVAEAEQQTFILEKLPARQTAFVREFLLDFNGTQAAIRVGFSPHTAGQIAYEYLRKPKIASAIARGKAELISRNTLKQDIMIRELACLALSNVAHYVITDEGEVSLAEGAPPNAMAAVQSIDRTTTEKIDPKTGEITRTYNVKLKLWDKPRPLQLLGKHAGIASFVDRLEVTGKDGGPIEIAAARLAELPIEALKQKMLQLADQAPVEAEFTEVLEKAS